MKILSWIESNIYRSEVRIKFLRRLCGGENFMFLIPGVDWKWLAAMAD